MTKKIESCPSEKILVDVDPQNGNDTADGKTLKTALYSLWGAIKVIHQDGPGDYDIRVISQGKSTPSPESGP